MQRNPYTPGAGFVPAYLAGREHLLSEAQNALDSIQHRYPQRSLVYYGLRGVGKTVLLLAIEEMADNLSILHTYIEASEKGNFTGRLANALGRILRDVSRNEGAKALVQRSLSVLRLFSVTYDTKAQSFEVGFTSGADTEGTIASRNYSDDLTEVFVSLGRALSKTGDTVCIFVDEVQYLSSEELAGLVSAVHRCNQLRLPVMLFCAGLPKILKTIGEARSYAERLFQYEIIGALNREESASAIIEPAKDSGVHFEDAAIERVIDLTGGYPYFIQELCGTIWHAAPEGTERISEQNVIDAESPFLTRLDTGFFAVRYHRCTKSEKEFLNAMVQCGHLPCGISQVAGVMGRTARSISPCRAQLINKGLIYGTSRAEIDFTVPKFDEFIRRTNAASTQ